MDFPGETDNLSANDVSIGAKCAFYSVAFTLAVRLALFPLEKMPEAVNYFCASLPFLNCIIVISQLCCNSLISWLKRFGAYAVTSIVLWVPVIAVLLSIVNTDESTCYSCVGFYWVTVAAFQYIIGNICGVAASLIFTIRNRRKTMHLPINLTNGEKI